MTKRKTGSTSSNEPVWMFVNEDDQKDAFYDPGTPTWTSTAFIGVDPLDIADTKPYSKVVLKAKKNQDMIQFRYGNNGNGTLAGVFAIAKLVEFIFEKFPLYAYWAIMGLIISSPVAIFLMGDFPGVTVISLVTGAAALAVGIVIAMKLGE